MREADFHVERVLSGERRIEGISSRAAGSVGGWGDFDSQLSQCYGGYVGHLNKPAVAVSYTPDKKGYWIFAADGGVFSFCDADFYGSMAGNHLNAPVVGGVGVP